MSADETTLSLANAILLYQSSRGDVYATSHKVMPDDRNPGRKIIGAGAPLSKASLAKFAGAVSTATAFSGFIPENLLFSSPNLIAWWTPAQVRTTWFKKAGVGTIAASGPAAHPALVFVATVGGWHVFALRDSARPAPITSLCHSPHFNVWAGGTICTGNVKLPPTLGADAIDHYEGAFFRSHFTHPSRDGAVKYEGGMQALWKDQLAQPDPEAMRRALVDSNETLQDAIARIAGRNTQ